MIELIFSVCLVSLCFEIRKLKRKISELEEENRHLKSKIDFASIDY